MTISPFPTAGELIWFRDQAEVGMVDTCEITRQVDLDSRTFDNATGQYSTTTTVPIYAGTCRVQLTSTSVGIAFKSRDAGAREATVMQPELQLPVTDTDDVSVGDVVKLVTSTFEPSLVDREFTVLARHEKTHAAFRRLRLAEVVG